MMKLGYIESLKAKRVFMHLLEVPTTHPSNMVILNSLYIFLLNIRLNLLLLSL